MSNQKKEKQDLQKLSMSPFVQFTEDDRKIADEFLELESECKGNVEKIVNEEEKDGPSSKQKLAKSKKVRKVEKEKAVFICAYCQKEFSYSSKLKQHVPVHTGQKDYNCNLCDYSCAQKSDLEIHIRRHLKERPYKCQEPNCGASFMTSGHLKRHQIVHKKTNKKFICSFCSYKTHLKANLTRHMKIIHSELKPFKCPHENCEFSAKTKSDLNRHLEIHSVEKNLFCPHPNCGFKTNSSENLKRHRKTHSIGEKRHNCHFCEYSSHQHCNLVRHIRSHTLETPFACQLCPFKSKNKGDLNKHMKKHAN